MESKKATKALIPGTNLVKSHRELLKTWAKKVGWRLLLSTYKQESIGPGIPEWKIFF